MIVVCQVLIEPLSLQVLDFWTDTIVTSKEVMEITEMIDEEATHALTMGDTLEGARIVAEIPKSLFTPRPKKYKREMVPIRVSLWNLLRTKLSMKEKGKAITIETDEEQECLEDQIITEDKDEGMEVETEPAHPPTNLPAYVPLRKGKAKVPKDPDETKRSL